MEKFLGISFIGRSDIATICKKRPILNICCVLVFSLLLVAFRAEAMPQKESNKSVLSSLFTRSSGNSTRWAVPSPSCFIRSACISDANFKKEFKNFVTFINTRYPTAQVPSAERLQRHVCHTLSSGGSNSADDLEVASATMGQWLATFLSYDYWSTQAGTNPYPTSPVWWCFLDSSTHYVITDTEEIDGATNIISTFDGLGKSLASGGAGFYVNQATVTDAYPITSLEPGVFAAQTFTNKELVSIDLTAPGTTKPLSQYQSLMKIQSHTTYPRRTISFIQETVNKLATIEWLGLCSVGCTNCTPGTICPLTS